MARHLVAAGWSVRATHIGRFHALLDAPLGHHVEVEREVRVLHRRLVVHPLILYAGGGGVSGDDGRRVRLRPVRRGVCLDAGTRLANRRPLRKGHTKQRRNERRVGTPLGSACRPHLEHDAVLVEYSVGGVPRVPLQRRDRLVQFVHNLRHRERRGAVVGERFSAAALNFDGLGWILNATARCYKLQP